MASTSSEYTRVKSSHCDESDSLSPGPRDEKEGDRLLAAEADAVRVKRRRAFCTCGIIVLTVAGAIGVGVYFLTKAVTDNSVTRSPLLFSDVFNTEFQPRYFLVVKFLQRALTEGMPFFSTCQAHVLLTSASSDSIYLTTIKE